VERPGEVQGEGGGGASPRIQAFAFPGSLDAPGRPPGHGKHFPVVHSEGAAFHRLFGLHSQGHRLPARAGKGAGRPDDGRLTRRKNPADFMRLDQAGARRQTKDPPASVGLQLARERFPGALPD